MIQSDDNRPDPYELFASLENEEKKSKRGKLKIFFGMCAGVGKTYTMLKAAHTEKAKGCNIIIGYVETHGRRETEELAKGFVEIPRKIYEYQSASLQEMDLDAIITSKPKIVLVDELAHTNAPGSRHTKRYQDIIISIEYSDGSGDFYEIQSQFAGNQRRICSLGTRSTRLLVSGENREGSPGKY